MSLQDRLEQVFIFEELLDRKRSRLRERPRRPRVLFIGGGATPTSGDDEFVLAHLQSLGLRVEYKQANASLVTADMVGKDLGIISSTVTSSQVRGKFDSLAVPQMTWEEALYKTAAGDYCMASSSLKPTSTDINVVDDTHPIMVAAGLSNGVVTIGGNDIRSCPEGTIPAGADVLAELPGNPGCKSLLVCNIGGADQCGGNFPGRRANFPLEDSGFDDLNATGINLFNATIDWLLGII